MSSRDRSVLASAGLLSTWYSEPDGVGGGAEVLGVDARFVETEEVTGLAESELVQAGRLTAQATAATAATTNFTARSSIGWERTPCRGRRTRLPSSAGVPRIPFGASYQPIVEPLWAAPVGGGRTRPSRTAARPLNTLCP